MNSKYITTFEFPNNINNEHKLNKTREIINKKSDVNRTTFCGIICNLIKNENDENILNILNKLLYFGNTLNVYLINKKYPYISAQMYGNNFENNLQHEFKKKLLENKELSDFEIDYIIEFIEKNDNDCEIFQLIKNIYNYYKDRDELKFYSSIILLNIILKMDKSCLRYE